jgi:hypothetical protein
MSIDVLWGAPLIQGDPSERVVAINWNEWARSIGMTGRDQPVRAIRLPLGFFVTADDLY